MRKTHRKNLQLGDKSKRAFIVYNEQCNLPISHLEVGLNVHHLGPGVVPEQGVHGHDDAWGAESALGPVRVSHSLLDCVEPGTGGKYEECLEARRCIFKQYLSMQPSGLST